MLFFQILIPILFFLTGLAFGSFSNVIIYREESGIGLFAKAHSFCPECQHALAWYDNIPLLSYLLLRGKCRYCGKPISRRYPLVESFGALLFLAVYFVYAYLYDGPCFVYHYFDSPLAAVDSVVFAFLLLALFDGALIDHKTNTLPLYLSLIVVLLSLVRYVIQAILTQSYLPYHLISVGVAVTLFLGAYVIGTYGFKKEPIGLGDVIVLVGLAFAFDILSYGLFVILVSVLSSVIELIRQKKKGPRAIPFIPYLFVGALFLVFFAPPLCSVILEFLGF
jgi:leader peptidase (prepilin peptidase)/N-methyltransferase